ncbi:hypothetical protein GCM10023347_32700 [Streptomyces chumphonensis]|uniref:Uncharacterized protein n=1 Tax=Streptomyces chumphonensis TaxID=1214925 RepID=A0A927IE41_9ACTN|nr:hypothetical protein [Streptomyces chumphonensis]MBD3933555.1 hypothetical protein [Streptomyces chumphonensis]
MNTYETQGSGDAAGLARAQEAASRFAAYLREGPPDGVEQSPPQLLTGDWPMPAGTRSVYAVGQALVLRGAFTQADTFALKRAFPGQLVTLDEAEGPERGTATLVVWPPDLSGSTA